MSIIAIANGAGSAGKTTTAVTLAALLAGEGRHVTLIDADPQANASTWLAEPGPGLGRVLTREVDLDTALSTTQVDGLTLLAADRGLETVGVELGRVPLGAQLRLRAALSKRSEPAEITIIDCPGSMSLLTVLSLIAADHVVTVVTPSVKEIEPLPDVIATVEEIRDTYGTGVEVSAIVPCIVPPGNAGRLYTDAMTLLDQSWPTLPTHPVRRSVRVGEAYATRTPLPVFAPLEPVTRDYEAVLADLKQRQVIPA